MSDQIRDTQIVKTPEVIIDPRFYVPEDVAGARVALPGELIPNDPDSTGDEDGDTFEPEVVWEDPGTTEDDPITSLQTPQFVTVLAQTPRTTADGTTVIDVILSCDDVPGATNYEVRINT